MTLIATHTDTLCYHCGDKCKGNDFIINDKSFCCNGCKVVYELLSENELCTYYNLENTPGNKIEDVTIASKFSFLEDENVQKELLDFNDQGVGVITLSIPSIHCSSCIWLLENLFKINDGVLNSRVNFLKKELTINFSSERISLKELVVLLSQLGYEPHLTLDSLNKNENINQDKSLYYKLGIAGFCFGNIMFLSFPEYFSLGDFVYSEFRSFFGIVSLFLSLPIILYSGNDYLISAFNGLKHKQINIDVPISIGIITLFVVSVIEVFSTGNLGYFDSLSGLIFFLLLGRFFQQKTYETISFERDFKSYFPISVTKITNSEEESISVRDIAVGDRILLRNKELIPADAVLIEGKGNIDYSFVTGESNPVSKTDGDYLYAGGRQKGENITIEIIKEFDQSYLTKLWNHEAFDKGKESKLQNITNYISKNFTVAVIAIALLSVAFHIFFSTGLSVKAFTSVLIIACPCALALSAPFTLGNILRAFGSLKLYLKNAEVTESLAQIDTIVFDKTGTLTDPVKALVSYEGEQLTQREKELIKEVTRHSTHPLSRQILTSLSSEELNEEGSSILVNYEEVTGLGIIGFTTQNTEIKIGKQSFVDKDRTQSDRFKEKGSGVFLSINGEVKGRFVIKNVYRQGLKELLGNLGNDYKLFVISGDNDSEKETLNELFPKSSELIFNQAPQDKLSFVEELMNKGKKVLMVGDGLNDAGALKKSNVGISLTEDIHSFTPACDAVLDAGKLHKIAAFLKLSKSGMDIIKISFAISFLYNVVGLTYAVQGLLSPVISAILMPLSSISIVLFTTIAVNFSAYKIFKNYNSKLNI